MHDEKLTGAQRYRLHRTLLGKELLVLEVEVEWANGPDNIYGMPMYLAGKQWRDANVRDLSGIAIQCRPKESK